MRAVCGALVLGALAAAAGEAAPFRLEPGDNRYIQFSVTHVPTLMDCTFKVLKGEPSVHMEVMSDVSYRQYIRGRDYEPLASSAEGESGEIRRLLDERGRFDVMLVNTGTAAVVVEMEVRTDLDPSAESLARVLSPERRLTVILVSFGLFFGMVIWAGVKLLRGVNLRAGR
jgi:hypothetical protein